MTIPETKGRRPGVKFHRPIWSWHNLGACAFHTNDACTGALGKSKTCVWRWQERFMREGFDGLIYDKTRPPGTPPIEAHGVEEIIALILKPPPHEAPHMEDTDVEEAAWQLRGASAMLAEIRQAFFQIFTRFQ